MRSDWDDSLATFVAIKGGTPNHSYAHMDVGGFVLEDTWTTGESVTASWQWLTHATVTRTATRVLLTQAGKTLTLRVNASAEWTVAIEDVSKPRHPQDSANPRVSRIVIQVPTAANHAGSLTVEMIPGSVTSGSR